MEIDVDDVGGKSCGIEGEVHLLDFVQLKLELASGIGGLFYGWVEELEFVHKALNDFVALFCRTEDTGLLGTEHEIVDEGEIIGGFGLEIADTFFHFWYQ
jgi:hypothetical protein